MSENKTGGSLKKTAASMGLPTSRAGVKSLLNVSLYRNAIYLMLNSGVLGLTGFFFWLAAARLYSAEVVGLASSTISAIGLLTLLATLGLDFGLIRFLPLAGDKTRAMLNSVFTIGGGVSILLAAIFLLGLGFWSPALLPLRENPVFFGGFVFFTFMSMLGTFQSQSFVAARRAKFSMAQGWLTGFLRFIPLILMAAFYPDFGPFLSWGLAITVAALISISFFLPRAYPGFRPLPQVRRDVVGQMLHFSFANYVTNILWTIPQLMLPIIVVNLLGAEQNAYFYVGWSIAGLVFMIPTATSSSLLAEASHEEQHLNRELKKSLKLILLLLVPAVVFLLLLGDKILLLFGGAYSAQALHLVWILAAAGLPMSVNFVYFTIRRVEKKMKSVILLTAFTAATTLGLSYVLIPPMGIRGVGIAFLISQGTAALISLTYFWRRLFSRA